LSFVEKALNRLKQEETGMRALGELQQESLPAAEAPVAAAPGSRVREERPRPGMIVAVDRARLREAGFLAPEKHERRMADEYRRIKRPLIANAFGVGVPQLQDGNLVVVSSAISGEGKTHTCINLALSIAMERDRTVLLVDGDTPKPHISRLFGLTEQRGLLDVLADEQLDPESLVLRTDIPNLSVLPAGRWRDHATELLSSERMRTVCRELAHRHAGRIVLFDSPPLLAATEAQAIGAIAGQAVLVIAENITARHDVEAALGLLDEQKPVNAILNKSRRPMLGGYYYGGYGYGVHAEADQ
jgi:exopolysaccharide/PEP-CTERM locus tyrosine autokinase